MSPWSLPLSGPLIWRFRAMYYVRKNILCRNFFTLFMDALLPAVVDLVTMLIFDSLAQNKNLIDSS